MAETTAVIGLSWMPKLPDFSTASTSKRNGIDNKDKSEVQEEAESCALWKSNTDLVDGLYVPPNDPTKLNKLLRKQVKDTLGEDWFDIAAPTMTPELKRDLQLLKLRSVIDPKRHYKKADSKSKELPKYFQVGTVIEPATEFYSSRLSKKERKQTLAGELLSDPALKAYRKRKVQEIEEQNRPGGNIKWKNKGQKRGKRRHLHYHI